MQQSASSVKLERRPWKSEIQYKIVYVDFKPTLWWRFIYLLLKRYGNKKYASTEFRY